MHSRTRATQLLDFIRRCPTSYQASDEIGGRLSAAGFRELTETQVWSVEAGGRYFVRRGGTALAAFVLTGADGAGVGLNIAVAHMDSPALKLKMEAVTDERTSETLCASVEVYGGPIVSTWLDRPLMLAGIVSVLEDDEVVQRSLFIDSAIAVIANPAIHMNHELNKGFQYNAQEHLRPVLATGDTNPGAFTALLAEHVQVTVDKILGADLFFCPAATGTLAGIDNSLIVSPRLDDLAMCEAILTAVTAAQPPGRAAMAVFLDHEEIGSRTVDGADSAFLMSVIRRLTEALGGNDMDALRCCAASFLISADMAHAIHPNFRDKHDPAYSPVLNGGPVIKAHAGRKYTTTAETAARFKRICTAAGVPVQHFIPRSDQGTGSTVGPMVASQLGIPAVDVGTPIWGMHSCIETGGVDDHDMMTRALTAFFTG